MASRRRLINRAPLCLAVCGLALIAGRTARATEEPAHSAALDQMIIEQAARHGVPEKLVRRIVMRESRYDPRARNHNFWGLMQISYPTAKSMGFRGTPQQLLNPVVNLTYAVPYLANAFVIAGKREDAAVRLYASGYYATAKRRGLLGVLRTADSAPVSGQPDAPASVASAPAPSYGIFGALFGPGQQPSGDVQSQMTQVAAYAPPAETQAQATASAPSSATPPAGQSADAPVALTRNAEGALQPPKKWLRDGGVTVIARGEQSVEQAMANEKAAGSASAKSRRASHAHKNTAYAALEAPPANAQAYAATAGGPDPALTQAASQAAITQATSAQAPTQSAAESTPSQDPKASAVAPTQAASVEPKKSHARRVASRVHHHDPAIDKPAAVETATDTRSEAPQHVGEAPARVENVDRNDPGAQQQEEARAADARATEPSLSPDPAPARKHHSRHAHAAKSTETVASQRPEDDRAQSSATAPEPAQAPQ